MKSSFLIFQCILTISLITACSFSKESPSEIDSVFNKSNLIAWCIIPYDNQNRIPAERAEMLYELGLNRLAYDWREEHIPNFPEEIRQLQKHDIELSAAWLWIDNRAAQGLLPEHDAIFNTIEEAGVSTSIWIGIDENFYEGLDDNEKLTKVSGLIGKIYDRARISGSSIALYNHGGWASRPENQIQIIEASGHKDIGIVFNFHHGHNQIDRFGEVLEILMPWLETVNLNGMEKDGAHILDVGKGDYEKEMIRTLINSGFSGNIGILGHTEGEDVRDVLNRNLDGLRNLLTELGEQETAKSYD